MKTVRIRDLEPRLIKGVNFDKEDAVMIKRVGYTPLLRAHNIDGMRVNLNELMYVKSSVVKSEQHLEDGDVIFVTSSGSKRLVGKSALVSDLPETATIGAFNSLLRFPGDVDSRYVFYSLNSPSFRAHIGSRLAGANINNIKKDDILDFELSVPFKNGKPDLVEQRRISDILDKVFTDSEQALARMRENEIHLANLRQAALREFLHANERERVVLVNLLMPISTQVQPKDFGERPYVGLEHLRSGDIAMREVASPRGVKSTKWAFQRGDILYGKLRPYLNKCVVADRDGICSTDILVLRPQNGVDAKYIAYIMNDRAFVGFANSTVSGMNLPRTTWSKINHYEVPIPMDAHGAPDLAEQKRIASELETSFAAAEQLAGVFEKQEKHLEALRSSVLNQSFAMQN